MIIDNVTHPFSIGLLIFLRKAYGSKFCKSYNEIEADYHNSCVPAWKIRDSIKELEKVGYLRSRQVWKTQKKVYQIDEDHYRGLVWLTEDGAPLKSFYKNATDNETEYDYETEEDLNNGESEGSEEA